MEKLPRGKQNLVVIIGCGYAAILDGTRYKLDCEKLSRAFVPLVKATCTRLHSSADSHGSTRASNKFRHAFIHAPLLSEPCTIVCPPRPVDVR